VRGGGGWKKGRRAGASSCFQWKTWTQSRLNANRHSRHSLKGGLQCCASFACTHFWINFPFSPRQHASTADFPAPSKQHYIHSVLESSTCQYQIEIKTPLMCTDRWGEGGGSNYRAQMTEGDAAAVQKLMLPLMQTCRKRVEVICRAAIPTPWILDCPLLVSRVSKCIWHRL
jgi:hypothetical protein